MRFLFLVLSGVLFMAASAHAESGFDIAGDADFFYAYNDVSKPYEPLQKNNVLQAAGNLNASYSYSFSDDYSAALFLDLMAASDKEVQNFNNGSWGKQLSADLNTPFGTFSAGETFNAAALLSVGAPSVSPIKLNNSDIVDFIANPNWASLRKFRILPLKFIIRRLVFPIFPIPKIVADLSALMPLMTVTMLMFSGFIIKIILVPFKLSFLLVMGFITKMTMTYQPDYSYHTEIGRSAEVFVKPMSTAMILKFLLPILLSDCLTATAKVRLGMPESAISSARLSLLSVILNLRPIIPQTKTKFCS